ncbi:TPA: tail fiber protein [Proteus mirabilis]|uniref:phage tail protein n=1 Tax=Enterobacterales TaxID=91347 RepID=UPI00076193D0|nr:MULTISPECIES: phage tail protein [Enterobacterales]ELZ9636335.1 tail fiber protein [Proteus mirabilis]MBG2799128.1 tail fiber protein [Proteus mirabilis]MBG2995975.1 tail fiber protein [Proteus mirabilis]MBG3003257.1 tail fiber protein [Proteus mirabilis]MBG3110718.1 tail fiber protein [Proteus mirabilis]
MATLNESAVWEDGIYQLEVSDPVLGGPGGIANRQAEQLANRTNYLKKQAEGQKNELSEHLKAANPHTQYARKGESYTKEESDGKFPDKNSVAYLTHVRHQDFQGSIGVKTLLSVRGADNEAGLTLKPGIDKSLALKHNNKWNYYSFPDKSGTVVLASDAECVDNYPVGSPIPWPSPTAPSGYLICQGQTFNKATYPKLAVAYPLGKLPDLRGEFIRGWDNGRGVDTGRRILSQQFGNTPIVNYEYPVGSGFSVTISTASNDEGANETRPRNIAFLYIVRAK